MAEYKDFLPWENDSSLLNREAGPDDRSGAVYLFDSNLKLAAETAIVTRRPLLLRGEPGSGKSSFPAFAARNLGWRYYEKTITGRTEARDLLWQYDALARLRDAQAGERGRSVSPVKYVTPAVLWWAFNRDNALTFVDLRQQRIEQERKDRQHSLETSNEIAAEEEPFADINKQRDAYRTVVLLDEIDKAEPDVPNDLLEVLGLNTFNIEELGWRVVRKRHRPVASDLPHNQHGDLLIVITTNQERDLPEAFLRRCIVHTIEEPDKRNDQVAKLVEIAKLHLPDLQKKKKLPTIVRQVAEKIVDLRDDAAELFIRGPSTAEFIDALITCMELGITADSDLWTRIERNVLIKNPRPQ